MSNATMCVERTVSLLQVMCVERTVQTVSLLQVMRVERTVSLLQVMCVESTVQTVSLLQVMFVESTVQTVSLLQVIRCLLIQPNPESALNEEAAKLLLEAYDDYYSRAKMMTEIHAKVGHLIQCVLCVSRAHLLLNFISNDKLDLFILI